MIIRFEFGNTNILKHGFHRLVWMNSDFFIPEVTTDDKESKPSFQINIHKISYYYFAVIDPFRFENLRGIYYD